MFDLLSNTSLLLSALSLITSLLTLFSIGHVTNIASRIRTLAEDEGLRKELRMELGNSKALIMADWSMHTVDPKVSSPGKPAPFQLVRPVNDAY